jgi:hypothetical protein
MAAHTTMKPLTLSERERITDSMLKIQSVRNSLDFVDEDKVPSIEKIETCLKSADDDLRTVLGYMSSPSPAEKESHDF